MLPTIQFAQRGIKGTAVRAFHTTALAGAKRRSTRKAELAAKRKAEADAVLHAKEQMRKLKDTDFLNSLVNPKKLFSTTQISLEDTEGNDSNALQPNSESSLGTEAAKNESTEGADEIQRKSADSGFYSYSVKPEEVKLVTQIAPKVTLAGDTKFGNMMMPEVATKNAKIQAEIVRRIVALENSNAKAVKHYNVQKAIDMFGRSDGDSGSPEVQAAVWTIRINSLEEHLRSNRKDHHNRRAYTHLLHKRAKILKYLRRESLERYYFCLKQLGLTKDMIEGEIVTPKRIE